MGLLYDLKTKYKVVSIVGMAKNAGKTTALNYLIEEAMEEGLVLGVTSTGRDGETTDLVTGTEKPKVYLEEGSIVTVPRQLYELAEAGLEILKMTEYRTSIGEIFICRVKEAGYVQIAGPVVASETKKICAEILELGAEMIIIDGAIDRKSIASPETSDGIIISTGAVLSRNLKKVVNETAHLAALYGLPELENENIIKIIEGFKNREGIIIGNEKDGRLLELKTAFGSGRYIDEKIKEDTEFVYIPGAFTKSIVLDISLSKLKNITFILKDPTKIFIDATSWQQLLKKGLKVKVIKNIKVAAVTVNPFAPSGYSFDHLELKEAVQKALPEIPVIDVRL